MFLKYTQGTYRKLLDSPVSMSNMTVNSFGHKTIFSISAMLGFFFYFKKTQLKHKQCIIFDLLKINVVKNIKQKLIIVLHYICIIFIIQQWFKKLH